MQFWGIIYFIITTLIALLKREEKENEKQEVENKLVTTSHDHDRTSVLDTYKLIWKILNIPSVRILTVLMLTQKVSWADYEGLAYLKFLDSGISNEKMNPMSAISMTLTRFIVPFLVVKITKGSEPFHAYGNLTPYRSILCLTAGLIIWFTPKTLSAEGDAPDYIYFVYLINDMLYMFIMFMMRVILNAAFIKISDPAVGGTYMTMLNTLENIGTVYPVTLALWMVERLTWRDSGDGNISQIRMNGTHVHT